MIEDKKPRVIFFDDKETSEGEIAKGLEESFELQLVSPPPLDKLAELYFSNGKTPNSFLTDYRLSSGELSNGTSIYYSGTILLLALREALEKVAPKSGIPLIAISQYQYFTKEEEMEDIKKIRELADYIIYKEDYLEDSKSTNSKIKSLIDDLPDIYSIEAEKRTWSTLVNLLKPSDFTYVSDLLRNSKPPLADYQIPLDERVAKEEKHDKTVSDATSHPAKASWSSRDATKWIIFTLMEFPGVFIDSLHASTYLGIDHESFEKSDWIENEFAPAKYRGIFREIDNFWWKYKFLEIAESIMLENKQDGPLAENFIETCPSDASLNQNKCIYSGEPGADKVCYFLKLPTRQENALKYLADDRPITMDSAFVSRTAYETTDDTIEELLASSAMRKLEEWYKT